MARQDGIIKLVGRAGEFSFYKTKDGHLARSSSGIDGSRVKNDASFERTRENGEEFGRAGKAGKLIRDAFRSYLKNGSDSRLTSRLTGTMMKVIKADSVSVRGKRNVLDGELELLQGFEFNLEAKIGSRLFKEVTATIDRAEGTAKVDLGLITPSLDFGAPEGATHVKLESGVAVMDFEVGTFDVSAALPVQMKLTEGEASKAAVVLSSAFKKAESKPLLLILGVEFYQEVNKVMYPLKNGQYNSMTLVKVSGLAHSEG